MIIKKILGIPLSLSIVLLFFNGCNYEKTAHKLPLSLDVKEDNICLYTNSKNSFLDENNKDASYYLIWVKSFISTGNANIYDKKITLREHSFPFKKDSCVLVPINLLEINKPYEFIIHTEKSFSTRACVLKKGNKFQIKIVTSTENCDK